MSDESEDENGENMGKKKDAPNIMFLERIKHM